MISTRYIKKVTTDDILDSISEEDLFRFYNSNFKKLNTLFCSDLRKDKNPSCSITVFNSKLLYKDFGNGDSFDIFEYLKTKYSITLIEVINKICSDFNLKLGKGIIGYIKNTTTNIVEPCATKKPTIIKIKKRKFNNYDVNYWEQYGITLEMLEIEKVVPLSNYWIGSKLAYSYQKSDPAYSYEEFGMGLRQIVRPLTNYKTQKWRSNLNKFLMFGYVLLPNSGDLLIITKSKKDQIVLKHCYNYNCIAPISEIIQLDKELILELKTRFKKIILLYDNDEAGSKSKEIAHLFDLNYTFIKNYKIKDVSDYTKKYGKEKTRSMLREILY